MSIPDNAEAIFNGLVAGGLSPVAASGVLGNIEAESGGDLNSQGDGGGGLLGYTPISSAPPGGAPGGPIAGQISAAIAYIQNSYPGGVAALNSISSASQAGSSFAQLGERCLDCGSTPGASTAQLPIRAQNATDVYNAYLAGTLGSPTQGTAPSGGSGTQASTPPAATGTFASDKTPLGGAGNVLQELDGMLNPTGGGILHQISTGFTSDMASMLEMMVSRGIFTIGFAAIAYLGIKTLINKPTSINEIQDKAKGMLSPGNTEDNVENVDNESSTETSSEVDDNPLSENTSSTVLDDNPLAGSTGEGLGGALDGAIGDAAAFI